MRSAFALLAFNIKIYVFINICYWNIMKRFKSFYIHSFLTYGFFIWYLLASTTLQLTW
jgi:hypothetical protein